MHICMNWRDMNFDWNQARAFLVAAEEGSLTRAAAALGLTVWGFAAVDVWAAAMMVPTLIWGIYAASLNLYVALLNPPEAFGPRGAAPDAG